MAGNIGAVARLMENFAAGSLVLVAPQADHLSRDALGRSTHGEHRLREARVASTLAEALEGAVYAIAASVRRGPVYQPGDLLPRRMSERVVHHLADGDVALVFGTEDIGLSRDDLLACDAVVCIPGSPDYPTLNVSHAVAICLYEIFLAVVGQTEPAAPPRRDDPADLALMHRLMDKLHHALLTIGYLHTDKPDHLLFPIRAILSRAQLSRTEAQILIGLAQQIDDFAQSEPRP